MQAEYKALLEADDQPVQDRGGVLAVDMGAWSEALDVTPEMVEGAFTRGRQIAEEVGDMSALESAYDGLPDGLQNAIWRVLAEPHRRIEVIDSLSDGDFDQLCHFLTSTTNIEHQAAVRAMGFR